MRENYDIEELRREAERRGLVAPAAPTVPVTQLSREDLVKEARKRGIIDDISLAESTARGALQGTTFGFGDEASAGIGAGFAKLFGGEATRDTTLGELYDQAIAAERQSNRDAAEANPIAYNAADIISSVALPGGAIGKVGLAKIGAGAGLIQGAGRSEGDTAGEIVGDAALSGTAGAILAPAAGKAADFVTRNAGKAGTAIKNLVTPTTIQSSLDIPASVQKGLSQEIKDALTAEGDDVIKAFSKNVRDGLTPTQALTKAQAQKFGVRLSAGDITQNVAQQSREELARTGAYGTSVAETTRGFREAQAQDIRDMAVNVGGQISKGGEIGTNEADIAAGIVGGLRDKAQNAKAVASAAYEANKTMRAYAPKEVAARLPGSMREALTKEQYDIEALPAVNKRLLEAERYFKAMGSRDNVKGISLNTLENLRKRIVNSGAASDAERSALSIMRKTYDDFSDFIIDQELVKGTPEAVNSIKNARGLWKNYKQTYYGKDGKALIGKIVDNDYTPETAMRMLIGAGKLGANKEAANHVAQIKNILGADSPEFNQLKLAGFTRLFGDDLQGILQGTLKPTKEGSVYARNLDEFLRTNKSLAETLFTPDDIKLMQDSARVTAAATRRQPGAISTSGTTPALLNFMTGMLNRTGAPGQYAAGLLRKTTQGVVNAKEAIAIEKELAGDVSKAVKESIQSNNFAKTLGARASGAVGGKTAPTATTNPPAAPATPAPPPVSSPSTEEQSGLDVFDRASQYSGVDRDVLQKMAVAESNLNPNARNPNSTATGLFQFTEPTWKKMVSKYGNETGIKEGDIRNPEANAVMAGLLARDNAASLADTLGREPTDGEIYTAHFLGADGAKKLLTNLDKDIPAAKLFPAAAKANRSIFFSGRKARTPAEIYQLLDDKINM